MKYAIISNQTRTVLVRRVVKHKQPIKQVAQQLKIKFPSAKSIVRTYKKTGRIFNKKKTRKSKVKSLEKIEAPNHKNNENLPEIQDGHQNLVDEKEKKQIPVQSQGTINSMNNIFPPAQAYNFVSTFIYSPYMQFSQMPFNGNYYSG